MLSRKKVFFIKIVWEGVPIHDI